MKNTLSFFLAFFIASFLFSQNISFGIYGGTNAAYQVFDSNSNFAFTDPLRSKPGYAAGVTGIVELTNFLAIRSGINTQRKGGIFEFSATDENGNPLGDASIQYNLDYLQIPLLVEASFLKDRLLFVNIGYNFGFLRKAKIKFDNIQVDGSPLLDQDNTEAYQGVDYSLLAGLGVKVPVTDKIRFTFEGRWENGISDINKSELASIKNRSVFAVAGLRYYL